jgi:hypothetical protein
MDTNEDIKKLKIEYTKRSIEYRVSELIKSQDELLFQQNRLDELSKLKKPSEDEKKMRDTEKPAAIERAKFDIEEAEVHIEGLQKLLVSYEENKPLKV